MNMCVYVFRLHCEFAEQVDGGPFDSGHKRVGGWILTADVFLFPFEWHGCEYNTGCEMAALTVAVKRRRIEISCCAAAAEDLAAAALISGPGARVLAFVCSRIL